MSAAGHVLRLAPPLRRCYGVEVKFSEAPKITRSMRTTIEDLKLYKLTVVAPGDMLYPVGKKIEVSSGLIATEP